MTLLFDEYYETHDHFSNMLGKSNDSFIFLCPVMQGEMLQFNVHLRVSLKWGGIEGDKDYEMVVIISLS